MPSVRFGLDNIKIYNGADIYVKVFQITSLFPLIYIFAATGYASIMTSRNPLAVLFDLGMCMIPRAEALALSAAYRMTSSEVVVYFGLLVTAIALGLILGKLFDARHENSLKAHKVVIVLIAADLVLRLLPFGFNIAFGLPAEALGFAVRAVCLALLVLDVRAETVHKDMSK